jgi:hypothetical protein
MEKYGWSLVMVVELGWSIMGEVVGVVVEGEGANKKNDDDLFFVSL